MFIITADIITPCSFHLSRMTPKPERNRTVSTCTRWHKRKGTSRVWRQ